MHNRKCNYPPPSGAIHQEQPGVPVTGEARGRKLTPAPLRLPGTDTTKDRECPHQREEGRRNMSPSFKHKGLRGSANRAADELTALTANP